jgi:hypothetical protein
MPAPFDAVLSNRKSKYSQRGSIANMSLRRSPNSDHATNVRHARDRASVHVHGRDRRTSALETTRQPLLRKRERFCESFGPPRFLRLWGLNYWR